MRKGNIYFTLSCIAIGAALITAAFLWGWLFWEFATINSVM